MSHRRTGYVAWVLVVVACRRPCLGWTVSIGSRVVLAVHPRVLTICGRAVMVESVVAAVAVIKIGASMAESVRWRRVGAWVLRVDRFATLMGSRSEGTLKRLGLVNTRILSIRPVVGVVCILSGGIRARLRVEGRECTRVVVRLLCIWVVVVVMRSSALRSRVVNVGLCIGELLMIVHR